MEDSTNKGKSGSGRMQFLGLKKRNERLIRRRAEGASYRELAKEFGISVPRVGQILQAAREKEGGAETSGVSLRKLEKIFEFILEYKVRNDGVSPTAGEIQEGTGVRNVPYYLERLERMGKITGKDKARGIQVAGGYLQVARETGVAAVMYRDNSSR